MKRTAAIVALVLACSAGAFAPVEARAVATGAIEGPAEFKNRAYKLVNSTGNLRFNCNAACKTAGKGYIPLTISANDPNVISPGRVCAYSRDGGKTAIPGTLRNGEGCNTFLIFGWFTQVPDRITYDIPCFCVKAGAEMWKSNGRCPKTHKQHRTCATLIGGGPQNKDRIAIGVHTEEGCTISDRPPKNDFNSKYSFKDFVVLCLRKT